MEDYELDISQIALWLKEQGYDGSSNILLKALDQIRVDQRLCKIYFEIASECIGENKVRKMRDARITQLKCHSKTPF